MGGIEDKTSKSNTNNFITKANIKHSDKYTYDKVVYIDSKRKVIITCPEHGDFEQTPDSHLSGHGCPKCKNELIGLSKRSSSDDFIIKAKAEHGDKYNYDKVVYINTDKKVIITCSQHGDFEQTPANHLTGRCCPKCSGNVKSNEGDFISKAKTEHGDKYNYDKVKYINNKTKVIITCPKHGDFEQMPSNHLGGQGCPKCGHEQRLSKLKDN